MKTYYMPMSLSFQDDESRTEAVIDCCCTPHIQYRTPTRHLITVGNSTVHTYEGGTSEAAPTRRIET